MGDADRTHHVACLGSHDNNGDCYTSARGDTSPRPKTPEPSPLASLAAIQAVTKVMAEHYRAYLTDKCSCGESIPGDGDFNIHLFVTMYEKGRSDG